MSAPKTDAPAVEARRKAAPPPSIPALTLVGLTLLLPMLSLVPLGSLWLWQNGYVLAWALVMLVLVSICFLFLRRLIRPAREPVASEQPDDVGRETWNARQEQAWDDVKAFADSVDPARLTSRDAMLALGLETVERVARRMHPEHDDPLLRFTLPEAFAVISEASAGLRAFAETSLPFGERITVAQIMWVYRWRTIVPMIEKGYDIWRIVRLLNPIAAATQELRERTTKQLYEMGREHIARRFAQAFVKEVGRAAVDLYGGSMRVSRARAERHVSEASASDRDRLDRVAAEPVRILVAGQTGAGKSSLINRLTGTADAAVDIVPSTHRQVAYRLSRDGLPEALVIDTPGLEAEGDIPAIVAAAEDCDMLLWVSAAPRAARAMDRAALDAIAAAAAKAGRHAPPRVLALTHVDGLRPFGDWTPPLNVDAPQTAKETSVRAAMDVVARELATPLSQMVPVRADTDETAYNIDALWAAITGALPQAKRSRLQRCLQGEAAAWSWRGILSQAGNAGRIISREILRRD
jgi:predicted GTPase